MEPQEGEVAAVGLLQGRQALGGRLWCLRVLGPWGPPGQLDCVRAPRRPLIP